MSRFRLPLTIFQCMRYAGRKSSGPLLAALLLTLAPATLSAQVPLPPVDAELIYQRLEQQDAELQRLRAQLEAVSAARDLPPIAAPQPVHPPVANAFQSGNPTPANSPEPANEVDALRRRIDALEKAKSAGDKANGAKGKGDKGKDGDKKADEEWTDLSKEKWTVKLGGHIQADYIQWANAPPQIPAQNYFEFRRLRLVADGTGYGVYDFRLQVDIEPESDDGVATPVTVVKDAYLTMNEVEWFQRIRVGNFFVPFSLEQVTNDTNNIFLERSIPTQGVFAADREVGIASYGVNDAQDVTWTYGIFIDSISEGLKERIDDNQGQRYSGRLTWLPYYDEPSNGRYLLHTGAGILHTEDQNGVVQFSTRPQIHEGPRLIDSGALIADSYTTGNIELATVWGQFSVQSELFACNVSRVVDSPNLYGAYVHASYFLTGENRVYDRYGQHGAQFARQTTFTNLFLTPGCHGWGAWEAKARISYLDLDEVNRGRYNDLTVGFNWYWSERIRMMFDWIHPLTSPQTVPYGDTESDIVGVRMDWNW